MTSESGSCYRERSQEDLVDQGEDRRVGSDAEREGEHGDQDEAGRVAEIAKGVADGSHGTLSYCATRSGGLSRGAARLRGAVRTRAVAGPSLKDIRSCFSVTPAWCKIALKVPRASSVLYIGTVAVRFPSGVANIWCLPFECVFWNPRRFNAAITSMPIADDGAACYWMPR